MHLLQAHNELFARDTDILDSYREIVLKQAWESWPTPISPQVLRSRLAAFKAEMTDENYALATCAICCREKRTCKLRRVCIPGTTTVPCPEWLNWSEDFWQEKGSDWLKQLNALFCVENYLHRFFCVRERVKQAEDEVHALRAASPSQLGFTNLERASAWHARVLSPRLRAPCRLSVSVH